MASQRFKFIRDSTCTINLKKEHYELGSGRISGNAGLSGRIFGIQQEKPGLSVISGKVCKIIRPDIRRPARETRSGPTLLINGQEDLLA